MKDLIIFLQLKEKVVKNVSPTFFQSFQAVV